MVGIFIPWSGEIAPIPEVPDLPPPPPPLTPVPDLPPELPSTPFPPIGPPIKYLVHGAEAAWSDIASWVSDGWHHVTDWAHDGDIAIYSGVKSLIDTALGFEQTAWSTFASALESQLLANLSNIVDHFDALTQELYDNVNALWDGLYHQELLTRSWVMESLQGVDALLAGLAHAIDVQAVNLTHNIEQWAIDNIFQPLTEDILNTAAQIYRVIEFDVANLQGQLNQITAHDLPGIVSAIGVLNVAVAALQKFNDECGEPMCAQMGPKTDFSKLLKLLNIAGMLALLTAVGTLTEAQLEQLAGTVVALGEGGAEAFAKAFVTEGDTLAAAIAGTLPQIGL